MKKTQPTITASADLIREEYDRRFLPRDLLKFTAASFAANKQTFIVAPHHRMIADALEKVERGEIQNLVINIAPRYGKTELAVINWIAKCLAANPQAKFIHLSYSDELALDNSSKAREMINSDWYQKLWPLQLKDDADSKKKWYTSQGGGVYATAAGGAITGFGAGITAQPDDKFYGAIIIDDPHKVDDVFSELQRNRTNERLNTTIKSRRNNRRTPIIIIMQRLHAEDMTGYVLSGGMGESFYHLNIPAINEDGTPLWPHKHTIDELMSMKAADPWTFSAQYMQNPTPEDGTFFKREWFKRYRIGEEPETLVKYGAADYAVSDGRGDYTEQGICGFDSKDNLWLLDWWSGRTTADVWISKQIDLVREHEPMLWVAEAGVIRRSVEPFLLSEQRKKSCYYRLEWLPSNKDKSAQARAFQALASQGKVYIPLCPWGDELLMQLLQFPKGKFDDKVDVCGLMGRILDQTFSPREMLPSMAEPDDDYYGLDDGADIEEDWMLT